jgi:hypothetical protein
VKRAIVPDVLIPRLVFDLAKNAPVLRTVSTSTSKQ